MKKLIDYKDYKVEHDKLIDIQCQLSDVKAEISETISGINSAVADKSQKSKIQSEAEAIVNGVPYDNSDHVSANATLQKLYHREMVLLRALEIQKQKCGQISTSISRDVAKEMEPQHIKNVKAVCDALLALDAASQKEQALRHEFESAGLGWSSHIRPMTLNAIGTSQQDNSQLSMFLIEAVDYGFIDKSDIPENLWKRLRENQGGPDTMADTKRNGLIDKISDGWAAA